MMLWDTALNYADRGLRIVTTSGIAPSEQLQWWERKDRFTRGAIAGLVKQRWPVQEDPRESSGRHQHRLDSGQRC